ncbi:hypothetical protein P7C73_g4636, partial [Tremellales sp. Uapishka_1]
MSLPAAVPNPPQTPPSPFAFDSIPSAIAAFRAGEFVVVMDDESRENEGDVICSASSITAAGMAWFVRHTSGYICLSMPESRLAALDLPPLLPSNGVSEDPKGTAYHLTIDSNPAYSDVTTGISAHDRANTARLVAEGKGKEYFTRPGHLCTLRYTTGGTGKRRGHTESAVDMCYLSGHSPAGLLCELVHPTDPEGSMARRDDCWRFAKAWGLKVISIEDLAAYVLGEGRALVPE